MTREATFGDLLRRYRLATGLTQEELAEKAQVSQRAISDLERGQRTRPWRDTIQLLAQALHLEGPDRAQLEAAARRVGAPMTPAEGDVTRSDVRRARHNLPIQATSFVGRERELTDVKERLAGTRLLTLTGTGGCGKTRLAMQVAANIVEQYPDGVWLVELASLADPTFVAVALATTLGVRASPDQSVDAALLGFLRERRLLLILDNCEHLLDACARLAHAVVRGGPGAQILATSREALGIDGEVSWRVPSLAVPPSDSPIPLEALATNEAVRVFLDRAVAAQPDFILTNQNARAIAQICRRLDGIPLAIELAATRVRSLSPEQIASRLDQRFSLLTGGSRAALPRQQTLAALVGWSYDLLSAAEKRLFDQLSVFAGGFTLEAAEWIAGATTDTASALDLLTSLVEKSLVVADSEGGNVERYRMLETLRAYGRERLVAIGEAAEAQERHASYFLKLVEECVRIYTSAEPPSPGWNAPLIAEQANLRRSLTWYQEKEPSRGLRLAAELGWFWVVQRDLGEGEGWLETFLPLAPNETGVRGRALLGLATLKRDRGLIDAAQPLYEESLVLCQQAGDRWGVARSLAMLAYQARSAGDYDRAIALAEESLVLAKQIGSLNSVKWGLVALGQFHRFKGDYARALALAEEHRRRSPDEPDVLRDLGLIAEDLGEYDRAERLYQEGLDRGLENVAWNWWRLCLSRVALKKGDRDRARRLLEDDLALARRAGARDRIARIQFDLAELERDAANPDGGRSRLAEGLSLAQRDRHHQNLAIGLLISARRAFESNERVQAVRLFGAADAALPGFQFEWTSFEVANYRSVLNELRAAFAPDAFAAAWADGQAMTVGKAVAYALRGSGD
jgi:non-specific serine/threonine protein kinase